MNQPAPATPHRSVAAVFASFVVATLVAVPLTWIIGRTGVWAIPGTATIAASILVETTRLRPKLPTRARAQTAGR